MHLLGAGYGPSRQRDFNMSALKFAGPMSTRGPIVGRSLPFLTPESINRLAPITAFIGTRCLVPR